MTITGTNDGPVIGSGAEQLLGSVKEDETLTASGQLSAIDADEGDHLHWSVIDPDSDSSFSSFAGTYGTIAVDATGKWTYTLANTADNVQSLTEGDHHEEVFTIRVTDDQGDFVDQTVTVTVNGAEDVPVQEGFVAGDANDDGVKDVLQTNVASTTVGDSSVWVTFEAESATEAENSPDAPLQEIRNLVVDNNPFAVLGMGEAPFGTLSYDVILPPIPDATPDAPPPPPRSTTMTAYLSGNWEQSNGGWVNSDTGDFVNGVWKQGPGGAWVDIADSITTLNGKLVLKYTLTDGDPLTDEDATQNGIIVDPIVIGAGLHAPELTWIDTGVQNDKVTNNGLITISNLETGATWQYSVNGGDWITGSGNSFLLTGDGNKSVLVRQVSAEGTMSGETQLDLALDQTAPSKLGFTNPANNYTTNNSWLNIQGLEPLASYQYRVNGGAWQEGSGNAFQVTGGDGNYSVAIRQTDAAENISTESVTSFKLDTLGPNISNAGYMAPWDEYNITWRIIASREREGILEQKETSVDSERLNEWMPTWTVEQQLDTFIDLWSLFGFYMSYGWTFKAEEAGKELIAHHAGFFFAAANDLSGVSSGSVLFNAAEHSMVLSDGEWRYYTDETPSSYVITFEDGLNNIGSTRTMLVSPVLTFQDTGEKDGYVTKVGTININGLANGATYEYSTDNGATWIGGVGSSFTLTTEGDKHVLVHQMDAAGGLSPNSQLNFKLDNTAPAILTLSWSDTGVQDGAYTRDGFVKVGNIEAGASFQYSINGSEWKNGWGSSILLSGNGNKILEVRQVDAAGNVSPTAFTSFILDQVGLLPHTLHEQYGVDFTDTSSKTTIDKVSVFGIEPGASWYYADAEDSWIGGYHMWRFGGTLDENTEEQYFHVNRNILPSWPGDWSADLENTWYVRQIDMAGNVSANRMTSFTTISVGDEAVNQLVDLFTPELTESQLRDLMILKDVVVIVASIYTGNGIGVVCGINDLLKDYGHGFEEYYSPTLDAIGDVVTVWEGIPSIGVEGASYLAAQNYPAEAYKIDSFLAKYHWPAGVSGEPVNLGLSDPTAGDNDDVIAVSIDNLPSGWQLNEGARLEDGSWFVETSSPALLAVTSPMDFAGAVALDIDMRWTQADGASANLNVLNNVENYLPGSPVCAWTGDDNLTGSAGSDVFAIDATAGNVRIFNFDASSDKINLLNYAEITSEEEVQQRLTIDENGNAAIVLGEASSIILAGVHPDLFNASSVVFDESMITSNPGSITVGNGALLPLAGVINNTGVVAINSAGDMTMLELIGDGVTLEGGGRIALSDNVLNIVMGSTANSSLINIDNTISGAGSLGTGIMALNNQGHIDADGAHVLMIDTGANEIVNSGTLESSGSGGLYINSALLNSGELWANGGNIFVKGAVSGSGSAVFDGTSSIEFGAAASSNVTFAETATGTLRLADSDGFTGAISGWNGDDALDLLDIDFAAATWSYTVNADGTTGGVLTVTDGTDIANVALIGQYASGGFQLAGDGIGGTAVTYA